jgi:hypothetical protein
MGAAAMAGLVASAALLTVSKWPSDVPEGCRTPETFIADLASGEASPDKDKLVGSVSQVLTEPVIVQEFLEATGWSGAPPTDEWSVAFITVSAYPTMMAVLPLNQGCMVALDGSIAQTLKESRIGAISVPAVTGILRKLAEKHPELW